MIRCETAQGHEQQEGRDREAWQALVQLGHGLVLRLRTLSDLAADAKDQGELILQAKAGVALALAQGAVENRGVSRQPVEIARKEFGWVLVG